MKSTQVHCPLMSGYIWLVVGLVALAWAAHRAVPIWMDGGRRGLGLPHRLRWTFLGIVAPSRYWWKARIEAMPPDEQSDLLAHGTTTLGLSRADSLRCPLCGTEVPHAWALNAEGQPIVTPGPVKCPECDFRLDACRHCVHFLPGAPHTFGSFALGGEDASFGRCGFYKASQPVDQVCSPEIARRLKERGCESVNAPLPIVDSFMPPDFCKAFQPDRKRLRAGNVRWPDARRAALLRLLLPPSTFKTTPAQEPAPGEGQWLL